MHKITDPTRTYLVIGGGDGYESHVVTGGELVDAYLALHFGEAANCPESERDGFAEWLLNEDNWSHNWHYGPISYYEDLEDAYIGVHLITRVGAQKALAEPVEGQS